MVHLYFYKNYYRKFLITANIRSSLSGCNSCLKNWNIVKVPTKNFDLSMIVYFYNIEAPWLRMPQCPVTVRDFIIEMLNK